MSGRGEKIKETVLLAVLNIALPSLDIYSDLAVILNFYVGGSQRNIFCDQKYNIKSISNATTMTVFQAQI